jgi:hypothetical protein
MDAKFNLRLKLIISRLKPIGPVRFEVIKPAAGKNLIVSVPRAEPRTPPRSMNAIK